MSTDEFLREFHHSLLLASHKNIITVFPDMVFSIEGQCCMFASEYAPMGDLTSNVNDFGIGEINSKRVARQIGSALEWMHSKNLCHLDVKLDNILVFRSDFTKVKLCDFGSVKSQGDIVIKKNELLPYCPPELVAKHANEYYQVILFGVQNSNFGTPFANWNVFIFVTCEATCGVKASTTSLGV